MTFETAGTWATEVGDVALHRDGRTGLRHVHVDTGDPHLVVALALRTPSTHPGVPHVLEHWVGAGSRRFGDVHVFPSLADTAATTFVNGFTGPDFTCFVAGTTCVASADLLTEALLDGVFHPLLLDATFAREAGVVRQESASRAHDPRTVALGALAAAVYDAPALSRLQAQGLSVADLAGLTPEQAREYHRRHYRPSAAWLVTVGDQPPARFHEHVSRVLGPDGSTPAAFAPFAAHPSAVVVPGTPGSPGVDALLAVPLEPSTAAGATARAMVLGEALAGTTDGPLRRLLAEHGGHRYPPGSGVNLHYPHTLFTVGVRVTGPDAADGVHDRLAEVVPEAFRAEDVTNAARRLLLRALDRSNGKHPHHPWAVQLVLDAVAPLVRGLSPVDALNLPEHLRWCAEHPDRVLSLLTGTSARFGRALVDHTSSRVPAPPVDAGTPAAAGSAPDTALPAVPPARPAPRHPRCVPTPVPGAARTWLWTTDTKGIGYAVADLDLVCDLDVLPLLPTAVAPFRHARRWRSDVTVTATAHDSAPDRPRIRLRVCLRHHQDDAAEARTWLAQRITALRDQPDRWFERVPAVVGREASATPTTPGLVVSAAHAQVSTTGAAQDLVDGWCRRRALQDLVADQDALRRTIAAAVDTVAVRTARVVITQSGDAPAPDVERWEAALTGSDDGPTAVRPPLVSGPVLIPSGGGDLVVATAYDLAQPGGGDGAAALVTAAVLNRRLRDALRRIGAHGSKVAFSLRTGVLTTTCVGGADAAAALALTRAALTGLGGDPPSEREVAAAHTAATTALHPLTSVDTLAADVLADRESGFGRRRGRAHDAIASVRAADVLRCADHLVRRAPAVGATASPEALDHLRESSRR
ncbi:insulinase family protein [Actinosynnema sp. NPDC002837]